MKNKKILNNMQEQLSPDSGLVSDLVKNIDLYAVDKNRASFGKGGKRRSYIAAGAVVFASLTFAVMGIYMYRQNPSKEEKLHSYVVADAGVSGAYEEMGKLTVSGSGDLDAGGSQSEVYPAGPGADSGTETTVSSESGDSDMDMPLEDLMDAMREMGFSEEDIDSYVKGFYTMKWAKTMTWAKWWKFHDAFSGKNPTLDDLIAFSEKEFGDMDAAVQEEAVFVYKNLTSYFFEKYGTENYPDWFGGAYITENDSLMINYVKGKGFEEDAYIEMLKQAERVEFKEVKYSYNYLREIQEQIENLPEMKELSTWACGVSVMDGKVELDVQKADKKLLAALAKLDPEDDVIIVCAGEINLTAE